MPAAGEDVSCGADNTRTPTCVSASEPRNPRQLLQDFIYLELAIIYVSYSDAMSENLIQSHTRVTGSGA